MTHIKYFQESSRFCRDPPFPIFPNLSISKILRCGISEQNFRNFDFRGFGIVNFLFGARQVKDQIWQLTSLPQSQQRLTVWGQVLEVGKCLKDYGVKHGHTITCEKWIESKGRGKGALCSSECLSTCPACIFWTDWEDDLTSSCSTKKRRFVEGSNKSKKRKMRREENIREAPADGDN